ncbi:MAG: lytic transglycosylase domain-containing protein [Alphaproteobacteria bacterium]|nr:lytic transglycosylase domain-containing protein [Alphaproteobacteria bacterium]
MKKYPEIFLLFAIIISLFVQQASAEVNILTPKVYNKILDNLDISKSDLKKYKHAFRLLNKKDFDATDKRIAKIDNPILMGHILAQKYLSPNYISTLAELQEWLELYSDHPQAQRIYNLAVRKGGDNLKIKSYQTFEPINSELKKIPLKYLERLSAADKKFLLSQIKNFRTHLRKGKTLLARNILENAKFKKLAPTPCWDSLAATLAIKYLTDNYDTKAFEWAEKVSKRHNSGVATWVAGLASWRLKQYKTAAIYFSRLGTSKNSDEWLVAAGAYWAARAYQKTGNTLKSEEMLKLAAKEKYTFYGILASYQLGEQFNFEFDKDAYLTDFTTFDYVDEILQSQPLVRALLLLEVKQPHLAEKELLQCYFSLNQPQKESVILLAHQQGLHSVVIELSRSKHIDLPLEIYEKEIYPLPQWSFRKDWQVDKALILALIRQESAFKDNATSNVGARGLMQLMPNTAYHISGDKSIKDEKNRLFDTDYNLELGQRYINYLLEKPFIEGNLFYMLTAYNGGPSNLVKWQKSARFNNDPLLFIEVIPSAETRIYIERVMANYWIYNIRFNQENQTLKQIADGNWPVLNKKKE